MFRPHTFAAAAATAAIVTSALALMLAESQQAPALWSADFETRDKSEWQMAGAAGWPGGGEFNSGSGRSEISDERAQSGRYSLKMTIGAPPESGVRLFRWQEPRLYPRLMYRVWYNFPRRHAVDLYWNVLQWKSKRHNGQVDPFFVLTVGNRADGAMYFYLYDWQRRRAFPQYRKNIQEDSWTLVEARYHCSGEQAGRVTIWQDGELLADVEGVQTRYADGDCQWSVNNYSASLRPSPAAIFVDAVSITPEYQEN